MTNTTTDVFQLIDMSPGVDACWPWKSDAKGGGRDNRPYIRIDGKRVLAYRLVWELVNGESLAKGSIIRHTCDNGGYPIRCCNPFHLEVGTHKDNMQDMRERQRHGQSHHVVRNIRQLATLGRTHADIAELYGMSRQNVGDIINRRTYKEVEDE